MKKLLEKQLVFSIVLGFLAFFARRERFATLTQWLTRQFAKLNLTLNKPDSTSNVKALAETWQKMMPPDGQDNFKISEVTEDTAYAEIHLHCPLRGTGDVTACYKLMNYDRALMEAVGGGLVVLESQSNSGENFCKLAIRKKGDDISDLVPAHERNKSRES